jgi:NADP-dependent 3-hydroxy acid dehydrogenase YdfG
MTVRRALVTGASSGIGEATVARLRRDGWWVAATARRHDRLAALCGRTGAEAFPCDLTSDAEVSALRDQLSALGPLHALVNNAGGAFGRDTVERGSVEDWSAMFELNVLAVKRLVGTLLPVLREGARDTGHADVLTVTSIAAHTNSEGGGGYNASKAAEHSLVATLRLELAGEPIRVVEVAPGMVKTEEFLLNRYKGDTAARDAMHEGVPGLLTASDVANEIAHVLALPAHVNVDLLVVKPLAQAAPHKLIRKPLRVADS